ncbi:MAG: hypothetical protein KF857_07410 [Fimbriimonadaceae bacterium]|nr:hypothetical protein [Fimbriimonadaceae bacterium]
MLAVLLRQPESFVRLDSRRMSDLQDVSVSIRETPGMGLYIVSNITCPACRQRWLADRHAIEKVKNLKERVILIPDMKQPDSLASALNVFRAEELGNKLQIPYSLGGEMFSQLITSRDLSPSATAGYAESIGIPRQVWSESVPSPNVKGLLQAADDSALALGIPGTPSYIVRTEFGHFMLFRDVNAALSFVRENESQPRWVRFIWGL